MASALFFLIAKKLNDLLHQKEFLNASTAGGDITWMEAEFRQVQKLLEEEIGKEMNSKRSRKWLRDLTSAAEATEDVIDNFLYAHARRKRRGLLGSDFIFNFIEWRAHRKFVEEIRHKEEISRHISESMQSEEVVGLDEDVEELVKWLTNENDSQRRQEMFIVGRPGAGKTTLARKVYNNNDVEHHFPCRIWVGIDTFISTNNVLMVMTRKITGWETMCIIKEDMVKKIYDTLKGTRYFVVLDINTEFARIWHELKVGFPDETMGSRIVLTIRGEDAPSGVEVHRLRKLSQEHSWKLLLNTFDHEHEAAIASSTILTEMEQFEGLPSEIVNVGAQLSMIYERRNDLEDVLDYLKYLQQVPRTISISEIDYKYNRLEPPLKLCLLYCSLFPRGFQISAKRLVQLWIAEGWIEEVWYKEYKAYNYLDQLVGAGMVETQRWKNNFYFFKKMKTCVVDTLIREYSIMKARQYNLCINIDDKDSSIQGSDRRLALHSSGIVHISRKVSLPNLRSLLCFPLQHAPETGDESSLRLLSGSKLLRVLDLEDMHFITALPEEIGKLAHLRYLNLRKTGLHSLPSSLGNLKNLLTLDIRGTRVSPIPTAILHLKKLQYLYMDMDDDDASTQGEGDSLNVSSLEDLRVLSVIRAGDWMEDGLQKLSRLTKLGIYGDLDMWEDALHRHLPNLRKLNSLRLGLGFGGTIPNLKQILDAGLITLYLERRLQKLPELDEFPRYLSKLCLKWSQLEQDPMPTLEKLSSLQVLKLQCGSFLGKEMVCSKFGFKHLTVLELDLLDGFEEWKVQRGAMQYLRCLRIRLCTRLKMLPQELHDLHLLNELEVAGMASEFKGRLRHTVGEDWPKIKHVTYVTIDGIQMAASSSSSIH